MKLTVSDGFVVVVQALEERRVNQMLHPQRFRGRIHRFCVEEQLLLATFKIIPTRDVVIVQPRE